MCGEDVLTPAVADVPSEASSETDQAATGTGAEVAPRARPAQAIKGFLTREVNRTTWLCSVCMAVSLVLVVWNLQDGSLDNANTGSRYATIQSLVDHGTYHIDKSQYIRTIDKYKVGSHHISSKPPTLSTLGAGAYYVYQKATGKTIASHEGNVVRFVSLCTGGLGHLVFLIFFFRLCLLFMRSELAIVTSVAGASFAYLGTAYATHINNHSTAAALSVCGFYYACRIRSGRDPKVWHWPLAGLVLGLLPAIDLSGIGITFLITLYLASHDWKRTAWAFLPALLPGLAMHFWLTYQISGSFKPFYLNSALKNFKQFHFRNAGGIDGLREPKHIYAFNVLLGHHGLFSMTPLFAFGLWELGSCLRRRRYLAESLVSAGALLAFLGYYIFRTRNYGGWCVGMRWLVPIMPLLLFYFGLWLDRVRLTRWVSGVVLAAFLVSCFHVQDGLTSPFQFSVWHNWLDGTPNRNRVGKVFNLPKPKPKRGKRGSSPPKPPVPEVSPAEIPAPAAP